MTRSLTVWWDKSTIGQLALTEYGEPTFAYLDRWLEGEEARPISLSLPLRSEPFNRRECLPFFEGLLPEEGQRAAVARALGVSRTNEFRLLEELGGDIAGALTLLPDDESPMDPQAGAMSSRPLEGAALSDLLDALPLRPMLAGDGRKVRLSLAGAQSKLPVVLVNGQIALPASGQPTTHILKPGIERYDGTTENEALCMTLAAAIGLDVAPVEMRVTGRHRYLLIERYDRTTENGQVTRVHQEDFCQALGYTSARKYAADGGPVFRDCFDLLRAEATRPALSVLALLDGAVFNTIIGNADAHAKNFSLLHAASGLRLAPLYDLLSTVAYPAIDDRYAMKVGKARTLREVTSASWDRFASDAGVGGPYVRRTVRRIAEHCLETLDDVADALLASGGRMEMIGPYTQLLRDRAAQALGTVV
ncbi:MAG: type II toxin-antitoxin system HipA family toxin [Litorimonas sp.]